jgi:hypothetical protein
MQPGFQFANQVPSTTTLGRCSICGGRVTVPTVWSASTPPVPTCEICGAIEDKGAPGEKPLPIIRMTRRADNPYKPNG